MKYLDTGHRDADQTLYRWLETSLSAASYFACQTGYFTADGLFPFEAEVQRILNAGGEVRLVVGANEDSIRSADLDYVLEIFESYPSQASLVLVSAEDVLMHAKTFYVERPDGARFALVGSANLTERGLSANIEAALAIESDSAPDRVLDEIKEAIEAWRVGSRANALLLNRADIPQLVADGVIDRPRPVLPSPPPPASKRRRRLFPALGRLVTLPRRGARVRRRRVVAQWPVRLGSAQPLPAGMLGIVKKLSSLDTKGFRGEPGTAYIALPVVLRDNLPMQPSGRHGEPRLDVHIDARLDSVPGQVVSSGAAPTNITGVGFGSTRVSHRDLRLNILKTTVDGVTYFVTQAGQTVPRAGDPVVIEFLGDGEQVRLSFVTQEPLRSRLLQRCTESRGSWGWVRAEDVPSWP